MIIDGHCDTLSVLLDNNKLLCNKSSQFNLSCISKFDEPVVQMMAIFISPEKCSSLKNQQTGWIRTNKMINEFYRQKRLYSKEIKQILTYNDLNNLDRKLGIILTIENGSAICGKLGRIKYLYNKGIRIMSITWNNDNELGCGAYTTNDTGLTALGKKYINELVKNNIIIDISHASYKTFFDVIKITNKPIVATHSCVYNLCKDNRNLKDEQIKIIAQRRGIIGVCYYSKFLTSAKRGATIDDIIDHITYIVKLVGIDYVGLGSDFDGIDKNELPIGIQNFGDIQKIKEKLFKRGFNLKEINKIMGDNWKKFIMSSYSLKTDINTHTVVKE